MRKIALIIFCLFLLSGCLPNDTEKDINIPKKEFINTNASKRLLILTKGSTYKAALAERVVTRLNKTFSFTVDDLDKIQDYNFATFYKVIFIEKSSGQHSPAVESYLDIYNGVDNQLLVAVSPEVYTPNVRIEYMVCKPATENIPGTAEEIISKIRRR